MVKTNSIEPQNAPAVFTAVRNAFPFRLPLAVSFIASVIGIAAILSIAIQSASGQELRAMTPVYRPGDELRLIMSFDAAAGDLTGAGVQFNLAKLGDESQHLWTNAFSCTEWKKLTKPNEYEVSGKIPRFAASGLYRATSAWTNVFDLSKNYGFPDTLHQDITITIINDSKDPLPQLKDLTLAPKGDSK